MVGRLECPTPASIIDKSGIESRRARHRTVAAQRTALTYAASKVAMRGVTRSMAGEYADSRIGVNAIVLSLINNGGPIAEMLKDPNYAAALRTAIPLLHGRRAGQYCLGRGLPGVR